MRNRRAWSATRTVVAGLACGVLALALPGTHASAGAGRTAGAAHGAEQGERSASAVIEWMRTADATIDAEAHPVPPESFIWEAYVSTAVYNAVVGIEGRFAPYKWDQRAPRTASSAAAAASAAHQVLRHHFPGAAPRLDAALTGSLAKIPDGAAEDAGVAFGKLAADHIIDLRRDDGRGASVPFPPARTPASGVPPRPVTSPSPMPGSAGSGPCCWTPRTSSAPARRRRSAPPGTRRTSPKWRPTEAGPARTGPPNRRTPRGISPTWTCKGPWVTTPPGTGSASPRRHVCTRRPTRPRRTPSSPHGTPNSTTAPGGPSPPSGRRTPTATRRPGRSFHYDDPTRLESVPAAATQHDTAYNTSFTARGNVTAVSRWDINDIQNQAKKLTTYTNYYNTGTPISTTDPMGHQSSLTYADSFSDNNNTRNTFAYPTTSTDADGHISFVQYNFDFGATTRTQSPAPAGQAQGAIQTMTYNNKGQLERITTSNNGAYKRFWYGAEFTGSYATVNNIADEAYAVQVTDGLGRVIGAVTNHPGSAGGYSLVNTVYNLMGRAWLQSNPTEVDAPPGLRVATMPPALITRNRPMTGKADRSSPPIPT